jgi:hypothetical protein
MEALSRSDRLALDRFARAHGRAWKQALREEWERACTRVTDPELAGALLRLRTAERFGARGLARYRAAFDPLLADAVAVRDVTSRRLCEFGILDMVDVAYAAATECVDVGGRTTAEAHATGMGFQRISARTLCATLLREREKETENARLRRKGRSPAFAITAWFLFDASTGVYWRVAAVD